MRSLFTVLIFLLISGNSMAQYYGSNSPTFSAAMSGEDKSDVKLISGKIFIRTLDKQLVGEDYQVWMHRCPKVKGPFSVCRDVLSETQSIRLSEGFQTIRFKMRDFDTEFPILKLSRSQSLWSWTFSELNVEDLKKSPRFIFQNPRIEIGFEMDKN